MNEDAVEIPELDEYFCTGLITGVIGRIKGGKEADVYCCKAGPKAGCEYIAAKIYRSVQTRGFRNDAVYQQGREILDSRMRRAFKNKSKQGRNVQYGMWVAHEFEVLKLLYNAGADVPRPLGMDGGAIVMEYIGRPDAPAEALANASLPCEEARTAFERIMRNIELFLRLRCVHSDLSPYNILRHNGRLVIIDFPQSVDPRFNPNAFALLKRDIGNICHYFGKRGVVAESGEIAWKIWREFIDGKL